VSLSNHKTHRIDVDDLPFLSLNQTLVYTARTKIRG